MEYLLGIECEGVGGVSKRGGGEFEYSTFLEIQNSLHIYYANIWCLLFIQFISCITEVHILSRNEKERKSTIYVQH